MERSEYQERISGASFGKRCLPTKSCVNIKTVFAKSSETATHNANGSLPTDSNLYRPPGMVPYGTVCQIQGPSCLQTLLWRFLPVNAFRRMISGEAVRKT